MPERLYHYTCDHSAPGIRQTGTIQPGLDGFVWLTDLDTPMRDALGLTMHMLTCDRTRHRFQVAPSHALPWVRVRRDQPPALVAELESAPGARPVHWWVAHQPVPVLDTASITCPDCGRTSYNPNDIREGYCGACHDWTRR